MKLVKKIALLPACLASLFLYSIKFRHTQPAIKPKAKTADSAGKIRRTRLA
jgi:hypothetical protein